MAGLFNDPDMRAVMGLPSTRQHWSGPTDIFSNKNGFGKEFLPSGNYEEGKYNNNVKVGNWRVCTPTGYTISTMTYDDHGNLNSVQNLAIPAPFLGQPSPYPIVNGQPGQVYFQAPPGQ